MLFAVLGSTANGNELIHRCSHNCLASWNWKRSHHFSFKYYVNYLNAVLFKLVVITPKNIGNGVISLELRAAVAIGVVCICDNLRKAKQTIIIKSSSI